MTATLSSQVLFEARFLKLGSASISLAVVHLQILNQHTAGKSESSQKHVPGYAGGPGGCLVCPFPALFSFVMGFPLSNTVLADFSQYQCAIVSFLLPLQSWCIIFIEGRRSSELSSRSFALIWNSETELQTQCAATIRLESGSPALWS